MRFDLGRRIISLQISDEIAAIFAKFAKENNFTSSLQQE
jgi:hypothetical protein